jgi:hypothetical protein
VISQHERYLLGVALRIVRQRQQAETLTTRHVHEQLKSASFDAAAGSKTMVGYSVVRNARR